MQQQHRPEPDPVAKEEANEATDVTATALPSEGAASSPEADTGELRKPSLQLHSLTRMTQAPEYAVVFEPGKLGLQMAWPTGTVVEVQPGEAAEQAGVKVGWHLCSLGTGEEAPSAELFERFVSGEQCYTATFQMLPPPPASDRSDAPASPALPAPQPGSEETLLEELLPAEQLPNLLAAFTLVDKNQDGAVSRDEFDEALAMCHLNLDSTQLLQLWRIADSSGSGLVSYQSLCTTTTRPPAADLLSSPSAPAGHTGKPEASPARGVAPMRRTYGGTLCGIKFLRNRVNRLEDLSEEEKIHVLQDLQKEDAMRLQEHARRKAKLEASRRKKQEEERERERRWHEEQERQAAEKAEKDKARAQELRAWLQKKEKEAAVKRAQDQELYQEHLIKLAIQRERKEEAERQRRQDIERMMRANERRRDRERQSLAAAAAEMEERANLIESEYPPMASPLTKAESGSTRRYRPQSAPGGRISRTSSVGQGHCRSSTSSSRNAAFHAETRNSAPRQRPATAGSLGAGSRRPGMPVATRSLEQAYGTYGECPRPPFRPPVVQPAPDALVLAAKQQELEERLAAVTAVRRSLHVELQEALRAAAAVAAY